MFRISLVAPLCLLVLGCGSPSPAPPPVASETTTSPPAESRPPAVSVPAAETPARSTPTSIQGPPTKEDASLRNLVASYVVSDGQGGWRPAEGPATELEKLNPRPTDLLPLMSDASAPVRRGAAYYLLGRFDAAQADQVAAFSKLLDDEDQTLRGFGLAAVKQMQPKDQIAAVPRLSAMLTAMRETKPENRASIARFIGSLKREASSASESLATTAANDPDSKVRAAGLAALVQVASPAECLAPLANGLGDQDAAVRLVAAAKLQSFGKSAEPAAKQLAGVLADGDSRVREKAAEALIGIGAPAVEVVVPQLSSPNVEAKKLALACLAKIGPAAKAALPAIAKCQSDADPVVQKLAEAALKRIGN